MGPFSAQYRTLRGGGWVDDYYFSRATTRYDFTCPTFCFDFYYPTFPYDFVGFRRAQYACLMTVSMISDSVRVSDQ
jgi:hypothetical protein